MSRHFLNIPAIYSIGTRYIRYIPRSLAYFLAHMLSDLSLFFYKSAADKISGNFRLLYPEAPQKEILRKTKKLFRNYAEYLVDYGRFSNLDRGALLEKIVRFDGEDNLIRALSARKGLILLTAHLGNWELGGIFFTAYGLKVNVVTLEDENPDIDINRRQYREKYGVKTITIGDSPLSTLSLINALNNDEVVAMLIDRYQNDRDSVSVNLLGRPARFPRGPFVLSRITGAPVVIAFVVKENGAYKGIVEGPITVNNGEETAAVEKAVNIFERYIVKYAGQWYDFR